MVRFLTVVGLFLITALSSRAAPAGNTVETFPRPLTEYQDVSGGIFDVLKHRAEVEPFNIVVTAIFLLASAR